MEAHCELCEQPGGEVLFRCAQYRIVLVDDATYPGFCRVIWHAHMREMTDLTVSERSLLMQAIWQVEQALRETMQPDKINLASLGNVTPHLHWHVIPRFADDAHFPAPIWAAPQRQADARQIADRVALLPALRAAILQHFDDSSSGTLDERR
jgi:diadenosine tetraphosphate (Ap4A) HIT family hydrolase